ncbi:hypothetical protein L7F22_064344 [Adiantum nelumboides]|nr:hypothetical protein [Adiantum nelumboides]
MSQQSLLECKALDMDLKISDKASQLAKEWVKNMTGGENLESEETDESALKIDGRPARLGLGAVYVPHSQLTTTLSPLEKKLKAKLGVSIGAAHCQEIKRLKTHPVIDKSDLKKRPQEDMDGEDDAGRTSQFNRKQHSSKMMACSLETSKGKKKKKKVG